MTGCRLALPGCGSPGGEVVGGRWSGGLWDRGDVGEDRDDRGCLWPRLGDLEALPTLTAHEPGWDVEEAVAQRFRLAPRERLGVAGEREQPGPGGQVSGDLDQCQPGLVHKHLPITRQTARPLKHRTPTLGAPVLSILPQTDRNLHAHWRVDPNATHRSS